MVSDFGNGAPDIGQNPPGSPARKRATVGALWAVSAAHGSPAGPDDLSEGKRGQPEVTPFALLSHRASRVITPLAAGRVTVLHHHVPYLKNSQRKDKTVTKR
jgi:hypothetical protein